MFQEYYSLAYWSRLVLFGWLGLLSSLILACGPEAPIQADKPISGQALYRQHCVVCHGADGTLALNGAADLSRSSLSLEERVHQIAMGKNTMPPFGAVLKEEEILILAQYIETLRK